jgi:hypothetical protein
VAFTGSLAFADDWAKSYNVTGHPDLRVTTDDGSVTIRPWDQNRIDARVITTGWRIAPGEVKIHEVQTGDRVEIEVRVPQHFWGWHGGGFHQRSIRVELQVPRELTANVKTGDGAIHISGVRGDLRLNTGDGNIEGDTLDGSLEARTGDGHVRVRGRFDNLNVTTGDGGIDVDVDRGSKIAGAGWRVATGDGGVRVNLPPDLAADVDIRTGDGHISMDMPLLMQSGQVKDNHLHGKLNGGGGSLNVRSGDGGIRIGRL